MKKIFLLIVLNTGLFQYVSSGPLNFYTNTTVYTCINGQISALVLNANNELTTIEKATLKDELLTTNYFHRR